LRAAADEAAAAAAAVVEELICAVEATGDDESLDAPGSLELEDFELLRLIGKGGYGKVFQVRCRINEEVYAMKVVDKASVERYRSMGNIATELAVLKRYAEKRHPCILGLECAFQSPTKLHFVMEYVPGGMLFTHLRTQEMFSERMARFYMGAVLLGLEHLHEMRIIYRDLKPENVLVCADGYIKLCDFGLAAVGLTAPPSQLSASGKQVLVGTTEYMAPEIIRMMECGQAVDVWAAGVLLFEMVTGEAPWYHREQKELQRKITHTKVKLPPWLTNECRSLLRGLLTKEPQQRLGVKPPPESNECESDMPKLKAHPFFRGLNWKLLLLQKLEPPLVPTLKAEGESLDVSNFDEKYTLENPCLSPPRKPISEQLEQQFEALSLEYMSPETRDSVRASVRSSLRSSNASSAGGSGGGEALLRFRNRAGARA